MPATLLHPPKSMLEVWETLPEGSLCQLINNKLIMSPAPQDIHQVILFEIAYNLKTFLRRSRLGQLRIAPYDVHFSEENIFQPDILFIKNEHLEKINSKGLYGSPDLIIEILSPSSSQLDFAEKKLVYQQYRVAEYFIADPGSKSVFAFYLDGFEYQAQETVAGKIRSKLLNTEIEF